MDVLVAAREGRVREGAQSHVEHVEEEGERDDDLQGGEDLKGEEDGEGLNDRSVACCGRFLKVKSSYFTCST